MATSFSFNTLQRRELFSFSLCKCFTTNPLHYSHSSSFPPPKYALTPKLSSYFLVNSPVTTSICPVNNNNSAIFGSNSTETLDYRDNSENSSDAYLISERIVKEEVKKRVVDNGKSTKIGERINLGVRNDENYGNSSLNDERIERKVKGNGVWVKNDGGDCSREFGYDSNGRNGGRSNYGKGDGEGGKVLLSKSSGDRGRRRIGEMLGNVGGGNVENSGREFRFADNGRNGARSNHRNGNDKVLLSKSSGDRGRRRVVEMLGNVENSSRDFSFANNERSGGRSSFSEGIDRGNKIMFSKSGGDGGRRRMEKSLGHVSGENVGNNRREFGYENIDNSSERVDFVKRNGKGSKSVSFKSSGDRATRRMENIVGSVDKRRGFDSEKGGQKGTWSTSIWVKDGKSGGAVGGKMHRQTNKESGSIVKKESTKNGSKVGKKEKPSKKSKVGSPEFELRIGLDMCSKEGDVMGAISLYDAGVKKGVKMGQYQYTVLLYLCSSAAMGVIRPAKSGSSSRSLYKVASHDSDDDSEQEDDDTNEVDDENMGVEDQTEKLEVNEIRVSEDVKKYALERGFEVYERMCMDKVEMNEAALTSVARMAMAMGNGDMAFDTVKQMKAMGVSPKLRSYGPALSVFSSSGELDKAFAVEEHMSENNIHPEEPELEALLRVSVQAGKADRVYYVLHKLRTSVRSVSPSTADLIEKWFKSKESSRVGKRKWDQNTITEIMKNGGGGWHGQGWLGTGKWAVARTSVAADGLCQCCGEKLALIDLDPQETENFAESVASIAIKRDKNSSFHKFQRWLDYYGPFEAVVDAANVGLFSQRKFKAAKVNAVVNGIRQLLPSRNWPLIILHNKRVTGSMMEQPTNRAFVDRWKNADALYPTPTGSNDDWYWLYAAIKFKCLLVTNDEMRDHTFQLLGNDFFPKWKERHQVRFSFSEIGPVFHMPPPCSVVIQESDNGKWHIPIASDHQSEEERTWLCITRPKLLVKQQGP